jgi:hypothetical protein
MVRNSLRCTFLLGTLLLCSAAIALADLDELAKDKESSHALDVAAGYRWLATDDNPQRAAEYDFLDDSPTFNLLLRDGDKTRTFALDIDYLNHNDYNVEGRYDYKALLRLNARTERFFHNLDHIPYEDRAAGETTLTNVIYNSATPSPDQLLDETRFSDQAPAADYGRRITIDEIQVRGRLPHYPAHVKLAFWRMEKKGREQLRFADENCASACHMQSHTRPIDRVTKEFKGGIDGHLGPLDVAFLQTLRSYHDREDTPVDSFLSHDLRYSDASRDLQHDETPEATLRESTFMINLPPSGGFNSAASYTIGKRENQSELNSVDPVEAETDYQKLTADVTYTPSEHWTLNFRYRMLELDSDGPDMQTSDGIASPANGFFSGVPVRPSVDIDRNNYVTYLSYRPTYRFNVKAEYEREELARSNTGIGTHNSFAGSANLNWALPEHERSDRLRLSLSSRLLERSALKLNGWIEHLSVDNPAYSTTLSDSNELFVSASYTPRARWGASGSFDLLRGLNDDHTVIQFDGLTQVPYDLERNEERENLALALWLMPNEVVSADLNYGLLHSQVDQDVLFGSEPDSASPGSLNDYTILDDSADYEQQVQTISAGLNLRFMKKLSSRFEAYHIRSQARFGPDFDPRDLEFISGLYTGEATASADGISDISRIDLRQNGIKARLRWQINEMLAATVEYTFDDFDDLQSDTYDGSVQALVASLSGTF